jgi:hypothetical protein
MGWVGLGWVRLDYVRLSLDLLVIVRPVPGIQNRGCSSGPG